MLPDLGDDPLRAVARLPGVASSDFSAKANMRGGETDETLFRFDGLRLQNPFHLKDFQSVFSTIDPSVISGNAHLRGRLSGAVWRSHEQRDRYRSAAARARAACASCH